tara:strand:- start:38 stop:382 length:345 start_codon:yes stop_codon:yes gene_type:complete
MVAALPYLKGATTMSTSKGEQVFKLATFNMRVLQFKYLPCTERKASRVKITDPRFKQSVIIPFDSEYTHAGQVAVAYLLEKGWSVSGINSDAGVIIMTDWGSNKQLREGPHDNP